MKKSILMVLFWSVSIMILSGQINSIGTIKNDDDSKCVSGDCINGFGIQKIGNKTYSGEFRDGHFYGNGIMSYDDGTVLNGNWENGKLNGLGRAFFSDGTKYLGEFHNSKFAGYGEYYFTYEEGRCAKYQEEGIILTGKIYEGLTYRGEFSEGAMSGLGAIYYPNDSIYIDGVFEANQPAKGEVKIYHPNGKIWFSGEVTSDRKFGGNLIIIGRYDGTIQWTLNRKDDLIYEGTCFHHNGNTFFNGEVYLDELTVIPYGEGEIYGYISNPVDQQFLEVIWEDDWKWQRRDYSDEFYVEYFPQEISDWVRFLFSIEFNSGISTHYLGAIKNGLADGYGVQVQSLTYSEVFLYAGSWKNGKWHGKGTYRKIKDRNCETKEIIGVFENGIPR